MREAAPPGTNTRPRPRRWRALPLLLLLLAAGLCSAQEDAGAGAGTDPGARAPGTGQAWVDDRLADIGLYAQRHRDAFVDEIVRYHQAPRALVEGALDDGSTSAGDIYYACLLAQVAGRPCRAVIDAWRAQPELSWQDIAGQIGIADDKAAAARIRDGITASYRRWARPIGPAPGAAR